jgi:hypothetical protein
MSQRMPVGGIMEDVHTSACGLLPATHVPALQASYFMRMDRHVIHLHLLISFLQQEAHWPEYLLTPLNYGMLPCPYQMCIMLLQSTSTGEIRKYTTQTCFFISSGKVIGQEFKVNPFMAVCFHKSFSTP